MEFKYTVNNEEIENEYYFIRNENRKMKEPITITITIEIDRNKYEVQKKKYKEPISKKIAKLFGF